ncbi:MAG: UDP-N-acetylmuramoyl-tripeptide--D-alanyl-D-alanine ligase [Cyanobacteriota bacterium]|nr:UDP-N-acetylmuramoyl-tripeptide--D-alanyl-D-alanine ligase [Cyanobacteriota bacterium]
MVLQLSDLQELFGPPIGATAETAAGWISSADSPTTPLLVCTDSRRLQPGQLFVPLVGESFDGHSFVAAAIAAGARAIVLEPQRLIAAAAMDLAALQRQAAEVGSLLWGVDDTLNAYQLLAQRARRQRQVPVVAVTGSAGKTTTRELVRAALSPLGPIWSSSGNENNDIGVPLTLLGAGPEHRAVVVEMGMRGLGEIERLSRCTEPDVAVITNIGTAHIGRLGSLEAIATAKCEITTALRPEGLLVIPAGDPLLEAAVAQAWRGRVLRVALAGDALATGTLPPDLTADLNNGDAGQSPLGVLKLADGETVPLPLAGRHNARNLLLAVAVARELGVPPNALGALAVEMPGGRNRRLQLGGLTLLDETYNASPEAVLAALDLLASEPGRRFAVLGTMLELGEQSLDQHRHVAARAAALGLDGLVIVDAGAEGRVMAEAASALPRVAVVDSPQQAAEPLASWLRAGDALLLKASRGVALEQLIPLLPNP